MNLFISNFKIGVNFISRHKALILGLLLFIACQWIFLVTSDVSQTASKQVVQEKRSWARTPGFIKAVANKDLILFFGNSHMAAGLIPDVFDAANDHTSTSYNMALVGLQLPVHYFLLKDYLQHNPAPKYILLNPVFQGYDVESFPSYAIQNAHWFEIIPYTLYRKNMDILFNYFFPARVHWPETVRFFTGKILKLLPPQIQEIHRKLYLGRFGDQEMWGHNRPYFYESQFVHPEELRRERLNLLKKQRGYYYIVEESTIGGQVTKKYLDDLNVQLKACQAPADQQSRIGNDKALSSVEARKSIDPLTEKFFQLTKAKGITVVLLPEYIMNLEELGCIENTGRYTPPDTRLYQYLHATYSNVYELNDRPNIEYPYTLFSDRSHLNPQGAKIYSEEMAAEFKKFKQKLGY